MAVDVINTHESFCRLQEDWQRLYELDDEATFFLSWRWMHSLLMGRNDTPCILAWYDDSCDASDSHVHRRYGALLPFRRQVLLSRSHREFYNALITAGNHWADYTGVLCDPEVQATAIPELGAAMLKLTWRRLYLQCLRHTDARIKSLLSSVLDDDNLRLESQTLTDNDGTTDLGKAPVVMLPDRYDSWMQDSLSANTRQKLRRYGRQLKKDRTLSIRLSTPDTYSRDINALQHFWGLRWSHAKGRHVDTLATKYAALVREGLDSNDMILFVLMQKQQPVAIHACYVDTVKGTLSFFVGARDLTFSTLPSGLLLHAQAIEWAIDKQFAQYDLLRGDEHYKYSLGAVDRPVVSFQITKRHLPVAQRFLDSQCRTAALDALQSYQRTAPQHSVHELYSQLLESWPGDATVLAHYEAWLRIKGDGVTAEEIHLSLS